MVTLGGGNLESSIVKTVFVYATGKVAVLSPNNENVQMKFQPTTGQLAGRFTHPALNTTIDFSGLALQFQSNAGRLFSGYKRKWVRDVRTDDAMTRNSRVRLAP